MTRYFFNLIFILAMTIGFISCNGQIKKEVPKEIVTESEIKSSEQLILIKTQGSHESDNVHRSIQDKKGNLWFGTTSEGIYKYNGKSFTQFTIKNGLPSNVINCIIEDKDGKIWIGTESGASVYDGNTFTKFHIDLPKNLPLNKYHDTKDV